VFIAYAIFLKLKHARDVKFIACLTQRDASYQKSAFRDLLINPSYHYVRLSPLSRSLVLGNRSHTVLTPEAVYLIAFVSLTHRITVQIPFCPLDGLYETMERMIVIETVENWAGVGLITGEMKGKYPFIKIK
jgi:hypothetical protein